MGISCRSTQLRLLPLVACALTATGTTTAAEMEWVRVSRDRSGFVLDKSGKSFVPWGFNYDHDEQGRLIEDYWEAEWAKVIEDFREMKDLGANVVRVHLQLAKFLESKEQPKQEALRQLTRLLKLAEEVHLYLDVTGLGCYHKKDVPDWYDGLSERDRWEAQAQFWAAVASCCANSPAVFCFDLMNEPVVPGGRREPKAWLGPAFAGKHFVQFVTLDAENRARPAVAREWIQRLTRAIRKHDRRHLITVGLVDWSLDRPGLSSGFVPEKLIDDVDFLCVHIYPEKEKVAWALQTLKAFSVGKPVMIEETFPLRCSQPEFERFVRESEGIAAGWLGFYWGKTPEECRRSNQIGDALMLQWLEFFQKKARKG